MADATRAQLERLLYVIHAASRPGGAKLADLARMLDTTEDRISRDIEEVTARVYYHPGGWPDDVQIAISTDRVEVHAPGLERPMKLSPVETLCLALALRGTAATAILADAEARKDLLARAEAHLAALPKEEVQAVLAAPERWADREGLRELLIRAADERRACAIHYVKPGDVDGSLRVIHPYAVAYGEGRWYVIAHCTRQECVRIFRLDRILAADLTDTTFERPADFDPDDYVHDGRVYHAGADELVRVRYSPRVARWIRERAVWESAPLEELDDGSVIVDHHAADPLWAVCHALQYGAEAEVLEPDGVRALVRQVAQEITQAVAD
ncbi:MAG TPA: WYL domain-containing protein [Longimicrobiales bacterium]|nr:WYL domain-containing protein [Longimicrobiales bacterium]